MNRIVIFYLTLVLTFVLTACSSDENKVFDKNKVLENNEWSHDKPVTFTFDIKESDILYNLYFNIRNTNEYPYYNLYIQYYIKDEGGKKIYSDLLEFQLFDPATGKPSGSTSWLQVGKDIYDHQYLSVPGFKFPSEGEYTLEMHQYMRDQDPIISIMAMGLRIDKKEAK